MPYNIIKKKKQLFICYKYFAILYRSLVNILKPSHVASNKNPHMFIHEILQRCFEFWRGYNYGITNIFRVSRILPTYFTEIAAKSEKSV